MKANYIHKDSTTLIQDKLVKNELNQIELQYNALKQQKFNELLEENQELKEQIKEYQKALDETMSEKIDIENNWIKLKEYIKETKLKEFEKSYGKRYGKTFTQAEIIVCNMILDKMQEIEGSDSNE